MSGLHHILEQWMRGRTLVSRANEWADELVTYLAGYGLAILPTGARELTYLEGLRSRIRVLEHQVAVRAEEAANREIVDEVLEAYATDGIEPLEGEELQLARNELAAANGRIRILEGDGHELFGVVQSLLKRLMLPGYALDAGELAAAVERVGRGPLAHPVEGIPVARCHRCKGPASAEEDMLLCAPCSGHEWAKGVGPKLPDAELVLPILEEVPDEGGTGLITVEREG